jgi:hypothetical protein
VRAERSAKRRVHRDLLADIRGADQVEAEPTIGRRDFEAQEIQLAGFLQQLAREFPIVLVESIDDREHFFLHELGRGLAEHPLFFCDDLDGCIDTSSCVGGVCTGDDRVCLCHRNAHLLTVQRLGSISLTTCQPSTNYSHFTAAWRLSPVDRAASRRRWRKDSPKRAHR